jgi:hypothetical protein
MASKFSPELVSQAQRLLPYSHATSATSAYNNEPRGHPRHYNRYDRANPDLGANADWDTMMNYTGKEGKHARMVPEQRRKAYRTELEPRNISTRAPINGLSDELLFLLADKEIKWNPKMMTEDGAEEWCENHPGYVVRITDINGDGLAEVNVYHQATNIPVWSCGYQIRRSKRPFQQRFLNEKRRNPEAFKRLKLNAMDWLYATLGAEVDITTGKRKFDEKKDKAYQRFSQMAKAQGFIAPKPNNLAITKLFAMYVSQPVYKACFGSPNEPRMVNIGKERKIKKAIHNVDGLQMMRLCPILYKEMIIYPLLKKAGYTPANSTEVEIKQHLRQKETQYLIIDAVRHFIHPDVIHDSWMKALDEIYKYVGWYEQEYPDYANALHEGLSVFNFEKPENTAEFINEVTRIKNEDFTASAAREKEARELFMNSSTADWSNDSQYLTDMEDAIIKRGSMRDLRAANKKPGYGARWVHKSNNVEWGPQQIFEKVIMTRNGPRTIHQNEAGEVIAQEGADGQMHPAQPGEGLRDVPPVQLPKAQP